MGPKTVRRLAILIVIVVVTGVSIYFIQRSQVNRMAREVLDKAQAAEEKGNYDAAIREYQERLMVVPSDDVTKEKLAEALLEGAKGSGAAGASRTTLRRDLDARPPA